MLATVHAYLNLKKSERGLTLGKIEQAISVKYPDLSMSDTKLSKIFKDPKSKVSIEELLALVDCMGLDKLEILAILGEQEYRASEGVNYKGATALLAEHNAQIAALEARYEAQLERGRATREGMQLSFTEALNAVKDSHAADLQQRDDRYEKVVGHLKQDLGAKTKSRNWWRTVALIGYGILLGLVVLLIVEFADLSQGLTGLLVRMAKEGLL